MPADARGDVEPGFSQTPGQRLGNAFLTCGLGMPVQIAA
jgi:hypothetical protein